MDYETSPTMKFENAGDAVNDEEKSEKSSASDGSEGFVKVDQELEEPEEPNSLKESLSKVEIVEPSAPFVSEVEPETKSELPLIENLDPREQDFASEKCLKAYYDQLPTETAPFSLDGFSSEANIPSYTDNLEADPNQAYSGFDFSEEKAEEPVLQSQPDLLSHSDVIPQKFGSLDDVREVDDVEDRPEEDTQPELEPETKPEMPEPLIDLAPKDPIDTLLPQSSEEDIEDKPLTPDPEPVKEQVEDIPEDPLPDSTTSAAEISPLLKFSIGGDNEVDSSEKEKDPAFFTWKARVKDLLYWRDIKVSGVVFGLTLLVLLSLCCFSVVSVISYLTLSLLTVTVAFRLYKLVLQTLNGTQQPNPFQSLLDMEVTLSKDQIHKYADVILDHLNCTLVCTRDLVLVKNMVASLKFAVFMWLLTYIGCCFNGLTLLILGVIAAFVLPPIYEKYQVPIDNHYNLVAQKFAQVANAVRSKIPGAKPKTQ
uniref:reticulon isoform X2 n=1 Tax=Ciona intestinalis TaxID=7719 RepID=UPI000EF46B6C|nr:reticulon isoform X2 [Ciona intestinalis]|eukprot:XP_026691999.1 reticulon isoform X2 [Ciona intestinalis]